MIIPFNRKIGIGLAVTAAIVAVYAGIVSWKDLREVREKNIHADAIMAVLPPSDDTSFHGRADAARHFVNINSRHAIDPEFYSYWNDWDTVTRMMTDFATGKSDKKPHMECSSRSELVRMILDRQGYRTRSVVVYKPDDALASHTFLEIRNPETGDWEISDPAHDLHWTKTGTDMRVGVRDLLSLPRDQVTPCIGSQGCGWHVISPTDKKPLDFLIPYLGLAVIKDETAGQRFMYFNPERFDLATEFTIEGARGTYCDHIAKNCRGDMIDVRYKERDS